VGLQQALLSSILFATAVVSAADDRLLRFAPPDTGVVVGINVAAIRESGLVKPLLAQGASDPAVQKWIQESGFDPRRDLAEVLIAGPVDQGKAQKNRGLFLLRGSFDPARIAAAGKAAGASAVNFEGLNVFTGSQAQPFSFVCLDNNVLIGGDPDSVRRAISRRSQPVALDPGMTSKAGDLSLAYDIWMIVKMPSGGLSSGGADPKLGAAFNSGLMRTIQQISGGLKFGPKLLIALDLKARDDKDASSLAGAVKMLVDMAASGGGSRTDKSMAALLDSLAVRPEGDSVKISLAIPEEQLKKTFESMSAGIVQSLKVRVQGGPGAGAGAGTPAAAPPAPADTGITVYSSPRDMGVVKLPPPKQ
jgi:hypothetical protein